MKRIQCKLRSATAVQDWLAFASKIERLAPTSKLRVNGKQRNSDGFYSSIQCEVDEDRIVDFLMEYISFLEKTPLRSFELAVHEAEGKSHSKFPTSTSNADL